MDRSDEVRIEWIDRIARTIQARVRCDYVTAAGLAADLYEEMVAPIWPEETGPAELVENASAETIGRAE